MALQLLMWDVDVPAAAIDMEVEDGWITLSGTVGHQFESDAAFSDVSSLLGVYGITNKINVLALAEGGPQVGHPRAR